MRPTAVSMYLKQTMSYCYGHWCELEGAKGCKCPSNICLPKNIFFNNDILILIYLSTAAGLTPGGSTHLHINNTQNISINKKTTQITNLEECWPCPVFVNYTPAFALQLRKKQGKTSVRVAEEIQSTHIIKTPTHYKTHPYTHTHTHPHTHTHTHPPTHTHTHTHTPTHTLQNSLKPPQYKLKQTQYKIYPNEIITI
jgi:hypothetical protein